MANDFISIIVAPLAVVVLGFIINQIFKKAFSDFHLGWKNYEEEKAKNLNAWREETTNRIKEMSMALSSITHKMPILITQDQCDESHAEMHEKINEHGERISVLETKVSDLRQR